MTELDPTGAECLSLTVRADWAHFRRIDTTTDKQTYRVIPRTTVAGLLAGMLGEPRDSYYDVFSPERSAIGIVPLEPVRTMDVPMLTLPTKKADLGSVSGVGGKVIKPEQIQQQRQRRNFEYLCDPAFRLHVVLDDEEWFDRLVERLDPRSPETAADDHDPTVRPVYTPTLGKSECLARITDSVVSAVEATTTDAVDSIVPEKEVIPQPGAVFRTERTPAYMTGTEGGRKTTEFLSYAYDPEGGTVPVSGLAASAVADDTVVFV